MPATSIGSRDGVASSESGTGPLTADRIAIGAAHRDQVAVIRSLLPPEAAEVTVDTRDGRPQRAAARVAAAR